MKKARFTEEQIIRVLKQHEAGRKVQELAREIGANRPRFTLGNQSTAGWTSVKPGD